MTLKVVTKIFPIILAAVLMVVVGFFAADSGWGQDPISFLSFGNGKIKVRFYADYFCGPCASIEPVTEAKVADLVKRNVINITFVDAPFHTHSSLYARYYLFILNERKEITQILAARAALFEAAKANIAERDKLEEFLKKKGIAFKLFDERPTLGTFEGYMREDKINSTPVMVVIRGGKKEVYTGTTEILKGLETLK